MALELEVVSFFQSFFTTVASKMEKSGVAVLSINCQVLGAGCKLYERRLGTTLCQSQLLKASFETGVSKTK